MKKWISLHVFLSGGEQTHRFLTEWLAASCDDMAGKNVIAQWFYIRYWDGGPHIRVRLQNCTVSQADLQNLFESNISAYVVAEPIAKEDFYNGHGFDGVKPPPSQELKWYGEGSVVNLEYEPEYARYGGQMAIDVNEDLFCISTSIAIRLLRAMGRNDLKKMALSIQFMMITAVALHNSLAEIKAFFHHYAKYWENYSPATQKMNAGDAIASDEFTRLQLTSLLTGTGRSFEKSTPQGYWFASLKDAIEKFNVIYDNHLLISPITGALAISRDEADLAIANIIGSQMHMFNNRLGLSAEEEYYFSKKIVKTIEEMQS